MTLPPHGGQLRLLAQTLGLATSEQILDFSANINPEGPPASVLAALRRSLDDPATLSLYPDLELLELRTAIARYLTVSCEQIIVANGFVPILEATLRARRVERTRLPVPAFPEYRAALERTGAAAIPHPLNPKSFAYDSTQILAALHKSQADSILLANPQNPSGVLTPAAELLSLFQQIPLTTTILLDEAFIDYAPAQTLTRAALPNLVVFRSVTKFFSMPGLRIAYAVAPPAIAAAIHAQLPPWPISRLAETATFAALADAPYAQTTRTLNLQRSQLLRGTLGKLGVTTPPPGANFLLLQFPSDAAPIWRSLLHDHQILLRHPENFEHLSSNSLRSAIRTQADNRRLIKALESISGLRRPHNL